MSSTRQADHGCSTIPNLVSPDGQSDSLDLEANRVRRRRYECTFLGCGRHYSRLDHLNRHRLNHNPKEVFKCHYPGCTRAFVREDLYLRHTDRHGSQRHSTPRKPPGRPRISYAPPSRPPASATAPVGLEGSLRSLGSLPDAQSDHFDSCTSGTHIESYSGVQPLSAEDHGLQSTPNPGPSVLHSNGQVFSESPVFLTDEFAAWLLDDDGGFQSAGMSTSANGGLGSATMYDNLGHDFYSCSSLETVLDGCDQRTVTQTLSPRTSTALYETAQNGSSNLLSVPKRQSLVSLMKYRFDDEDNASIRQLKEEVLQDDIEADEHALSIHSMQLYVGSYWYHFHAQMPILHQPTFTANETHDYLLLAIMMIGAAHLNKAHGRKFISAASRLALFIAWHLRWKVFMHEDFRPPTKLWVLQTLVLLEIYEKTKATRIMHERSHLHYATTINLMRRGTVLFDDATNQKYFSRSSSTQEWWTHWITAEATRRAAYAAFYLDSIHSHFFRHGAMMVFHELHLPLPCDDALWSATSAAEVIRVEEGLHAYGVKPAVFLDGLRRVLTGKRVRTNNFGRMILMAGLLSVSWHMNERDLQVNSLASSVSRPLGVIENWRKPLSKAFDFWMKDFNENLDHMRKAPVPRKEDIGCGAEDMAMAATVLLHFSHMACMSIDSFDLLTFVGVPCLFGRAINDHDYERVKCKILDWAKGSGANVGVFHALQLLRSVILPADVDVPCQLYKAGGDYLLSRPYALFFAALIVWAWGFALDGAISPSSSLAQLASSPTTCESVGLEVDPIWNEEHSAGPQEMDPAVFKDAHVYLSTVGGINSPEELNAIKEGRNNVAGVLIIVEAAFLDSRWELLHEAAIHLRSAVRLLRGAPQGVGSKCRSLRTRDPATCGEISRFDNLQ